jgi:AraC-like DNA-binding protein
MLTIPDTWGPSCISSPRLPFLGLPGTSVQLDDPVEVAERLACLMPVLTCDAVTPASPSLPFRCHTGGLRLGPLSLVAIWGPGLRGEVDGTNEASFILPYRGLGHFRLGRRSLPNGAGQNLLYLPPEPWRTSNDAMGGITIRLDPALIRQVGRTMAGPSVTPQRWQALGREPVVLQFDPATNGALFERFYWLMGYVNGLLLGHGSVPESLRLDDLLLRQIATVLAPRLLAEAAEPEQRNCSIDELVDWIHAHCHEPISLTDLENRSHYSRRTLQYAFKLRFGCGPMQYLRRQRLWRARRQLEESGGPARLTGVAVACGYLDLAGFSRDFRQAFGVAPSTLLRRHQARVGRQDNILQGSLNS